MYLFCRNKWKSWRSGAIFNAMLVHIFSLLTSQGFYCSRQCKGSSLVCLRRLQDQEEEKEVDGDERTMTGKMVLRESLKLIYSKANLFFHS